MRVGLFAILFFAASVFADTKAFLYAQEALRVPPNDRIEMRFQDQFILFGMRATSGTRILTGL